MIEEKEAKEDQGDDRLQVGRIGAEIFWGFHWVRPYRCGELFWLLRGVSGWVQRVFGAFMGVGRMDTENFLGLRGACLDGCRD